MQMCTNFIVSHYYYYYYYYYYFTRYDG